MIKMVLYKHQQKIIDEDPKKCGIFQGTGSGKTRTALLLARGRTLVIAPKTQVEDGNWERELEQIVKDFWSTNGQWDLLKCPLGQVKIISKETFRRDHRDLPAFDTVIVDEAHTMLGVTPNTRHRNRVEIPRASQLFEALEAYVARTKPERLYLCTATIIKSPFTVWAAGKILGKRSGTMLDFYRFRYDFYTKLPMPGREVWVPKTDKATKDKLAFLVREYGHIGRLEDFFDVPTQNFKNEYVELGAVQKEGLKTIALEYPEPIVRLGKRHQIENGVLSGDEFTAAETYSNAKIDRLLDYAVEFPKMIVFAKYRAQIVQIESAIRQAGYQTFVLTGDTEDRGSLIAEVNRSDAYVFIVQAQISAGWEVPDCPVMVFASRTYSFVDYVQAQGRILRANNLKKNLYINLIVREGVDEAVHKSLENKRDFNERIYLNI